MEQKVFDWTIEEDRIEYQKLLEQDNLNNELYPPQDRRSKIVREWLKNHPELPRLQQGDR
jgi:hypothetical protein